MNEDILSSAFKYKELGWVIHPLSSPYDDGPAPGKRPILSNWANLEVPPTDSQIKKWWDCSNNNSKQYNIGVVCGRVSGITVIDIDDDIFLDYLIDGIDISDWLISKRIENRGHIFFQHEDDTELINHEYSYIKIDIRNDNTKGGGGNLVLPPSIHCTGEQYRWNREIISNDDIPKMPDIFKNRLIHLIYEENRLKSAITKCRAWVKEFFDPKRTPDILHGGDGRRLMIALCAELKANGFDSKDDGEFISRLIYRHDFDHKISSYQWSRIEGYPWRSEMLCTEFPQYCNEINTRGKVPEPMLVSETGQEEIEEYPEHVLEWAKLLLEKGDAFKFIVDTWNQYHVGDRVIGEACACAVASTYMTNSKGLHIKPSGDSGKGKSDGAKKFLHLLPENKILCGSLSAKSMFYNPDLTKGTIIYTDDVQLNDDMVATIKQSITNFQTTTEHNTVKKQEFQQYSIPPRISWWMTSVLGFDDDQMGNRFLGVDVDATPEQDERVFQHQARMERLGITEDIVNDDVLVCRAVFDILGSNEEYKIVFPYTNCIRWNNKDNRRNFGMFMDILKSVTFYNVKQREKFHDAYLATVDDFRRAKSIYKGLAESNATNLTETELKVMRWMSGKHEVDARQIADLIGKSETTAKYLMRGRNGDGGLLSKVTGLFSQNVTIQSSDSRSTRKTVYCYDNRLGLNSYEDVVNIDVDCIEKEYDNFKTEYEQLVSGGYHTLSHDHHIKCDSDKSITIDRIYNTIIYTITQKQKMYSTCENSQFQHDYHNTLSYIPGKMCESELGSENVCDSDVIVCDSDPQDLPKDDKTGINSSTNFGHSLSHHCSNTDFDQSLGLNDGDLKLLAYDMTSFVKKKYPNFVIDDIKKVNFEFCRNYPGHRQSYGYNNCLWVMKKLNEDGWWCRT